MYVYLSVDNTFETSDEESYYNITWLYLDTLHACRKIKDDTHNFINVDGIASNT